MKVERCAYMHVSELVSCPKSLPGDPVSGRCHGHVPLAARSEVKPGSRVSHPRLLVTFVLATRCRTPIQYYSPPIPDHLENEINMGKPCLASVYHHLAEARVSNQCSSYMRICLLTAVK